MRAQVGRELEMDMQGLAIFLEKGMRNKCDGAGIFIIEHSNSNASANSNGMQAHAMQIKSIQLPIPNQIVSSVQWNGIQFKANSNSMQMQFKFNSKSNRKIQKRPRCLMNPSMTNNGSTSGSCCLNANFTIFIIAIAMPDTSTVLLNT